MTSYQIILLVIVILTLANVGTLVWVGSLQSKLKNGKEPGQKKDAKGHPLPPVEDIQAKLRAEAEQAYHDALNQSVNAFSAELSNTSLAVNQKIGQMAEQIITNQLAEFDKTIAEMRNNAAQAMAQVQAELERKRQALDTDLNAELTREKEKLVAQLDARLSDIVASYLIEALTNEVDLGAQSTYLFKLLEQHKEDLKKDILDELTVA